jgi:hypothetical protein
MTEAATALLKEQVVRHDVGRLNASGGMLSCCYDVQLYGTVLKSETALECWGRSRERGVGIDGSFVSRIRRTRTDVRGFVVTSEGWYAGRKSSIRLSYETWARVCFNGMCPRAV